MKSRFLFVGIGQGGNNIANEFYKLGYSAMAINTSNVDMQPLDIECKYKIPMAEGCAKDRNKAIQYAGRYYEEIMNIINAKFSYQDIIYIIFSGGGGTGSGISPILLNFLSRKMYDKHFNAVMIVPSAKESLQCKINTMQCYNDLTKKAPNLKSLYLLDNNSRKNKLEINFVFSQLLDGIINMTNPDQNGVVDTNDIEKLLVCRGNSVIMDFGINTNEDKIIEDLTDSIFVDYVKGSQNIGMTTIDEVDIEIFENEFGEPIDKMVGRNDKSNIVMASGMPFPDKYMEKLDQEIQTIQKRRENDNRYEKPSIDIDKYSNIKKDIEIVKDFNFDELMELYK